MANLIPSHRSRRRVVRQEREVHQALELAQANAAIQAGQQIARVRVVGRVADAAVDEVGRLNTEVAARSYGVNAIGQMRLEQVANSAASVLCDITRETGWR